jgi:hypothetical protein
MDINFGAVGVGAVAGFVLGGLWYSHKGFGLVWNREAGRGAEAHQPHPPRVFAVSFVFALATAVTFAVLLGPKPALTDALEQGLLVGIGFVAASLGITYQFANLSMKMSLIDGGYHVARFLVYAVILGLWH